MNINDNKPVRIVPTTHVHVYRWSCSQPTEPGIVDMSLPSVATTNSHHISHRWHRRPALPASRCYSLREAQRRTILDRGAVRVSNMCVYFLISLYLSVSLCISLYLSVFSSFSFFLSLSLSVSLSLSLSHTHTRAHPYIAKKMYRSECLV